MLKHPGSMSMLTKLLFHVFVISVLSTTNYSEVIGSRYDGRQGTDYHFPTDTMHMTPTDGSDRFRRASDGGFHENVNRMTMLARVLTGISLQNGLIDGSIPGDEAIAEMLNIGSVKLADLETFDKNKVDTFLANLKKASDNIDDSTKELETEVSDAIKIKVKWENITGLDKLPKSTTFDKINILGTFDFAPLSNKSIVDVAVANLESFRDLPVNVSGDINDIAVTSVKNLKKSLAAIDSAITNIGKVNTDLKIDELKSILSTMKTMEDVASILNQHNQASTFGKLNGLTGLTEFKANLQLIKDITSDQTSLATAKSLLSSISNRASSSIKYTTGFVDGFHDLVQLPLTSKNSWVLLALNTSMPIGEGLKPLELFKSPMSVLGRTLSTLKDWNLRQSVEKAIDIQKQVQESMAGFADAEQVVTALSGCVSKKPVIISGVAKVFLTINDAVNDLEKKLMALDAMSKMMTEAQVKQFNDFKNKIDLSKDHKKHDEDVERIVPNLKALNTAEEIINFLRDLEPHLQVIQDAPSFKEAAGVLTQNKATVIDVRKEANCKMYFPYFECLATVTGSTKEISLATKVFGEVRALKGTTDLFDNIKKVTGVLSNCTNDIKAVRAIPGKIKTSNSSEVKELTKFKKLATDAKMVGDAAAGVIAIQKAAAMKTTFQELITLGQEVVTEIGKVPAGPTKIEIETRWGDFDALKQNVRAMLDGLDNRVPVKGSTLRRRLRRRPTDFQSLSQFCGGQAGLIDVHLDVEEKNKALDSLIVAIPTAKANINRVRNPLSALGQLDLQFASHNAALTGLNGVLTSIQNLFATVQPTRISTGGGPNPGSPNGGGGGSGRGGSGGGSRGGATGGSRAGGAAGGAASATEAKGGVPTWVYPTVGCLLILIVSAIFGFWYKRKRDKKAKELMDELKRYEKMIADAKKQKDEMMNKQKKIEKEKEELQKKAAADVKELKDQREKLKQQMQASGVVPDSQEWKDAEKKLEKEIAAAEEHEKRMKEEVKEAQNWTEAAEMYFKKVEKRMAEEKREFAKLPRYSRCTRLFVKNSGLDDDYAKVNIDLLNFLLKHKIAYHLPSVFFERFFRSNLTGDYCPLIDSFYILNIWGNCKFGRYEREINNNVPEMHDRRTPTHFCHDDPDNRFEFKYCCQGKDHKCLPNKDDLYYDMNDYKSRDLVSFVEKGGWTDWPEKLNEERKIGTDTVKVTELKTFFEEEVILRTMVINGRDDEKVKHYEFIRWAEDEVPKRESFRDALEAVHRATRRKSTPVFAYGYKGPDVFLGIERFQQMIIRRGRNIPNAIEFTKDFKDETDQKFKKGDQLMFMQLMALQILYKDLGEKIPQLLLDQFAIFEAFYDEKYDWQCRRTCAATGGGQLAERPKEIPASREKRYSTGDTTEDWPEPEQEKKKDKTKEPKQEEKKEEKKEEPKQEEKKKDKTEEVKTVEKSEAKSVLKTVAVTQEMEISAKAPK